MNFRSINWTAVGTIAATVGVLVTISIFLLKEFYIEELHNEGTITISEGPARRLELPTDSLQIVYYGKEIEKYIILQASITYNGKEAIKSTNYALPLEFYLKNIEKAIDVRLLTSKPIQLKPDFNILHNHKIIQVEPSLLKNDESFTLEIDVIAKIDQQPEIDNVGGRVVGAKIVFERYVESESRIFLFAIGLVVSVVIAFMTGFTFRARNKRA